MIIADAEKHPPMLETSLYDSWKSRIELYIENQENGRMILNSLQNGPLVWPTFVKEDGTTRTKKYEEQVAEKLQADCDHKATNIVLQCLPPVVYAIINHHKFAKEIWDRVKLLILKSCVPVFNQGDDPIACLNKAMAFLTAVASLSLREGKDKGEGHMSRQCTQPKRHRNVAWFKKKAMLAEARESGQILDEEKLAFLADPSIPDGQADQTTIPKLSASRLRILDASDSKFTFLFVPHIEPNYIDMDNQSVHAMQGFEQTLVVDFTDNEITSDSNIIPYSQYLQETQQAAVQDTNLYAQQDSMILSVIEQISKQMINHVNIIRKDIRKKNIESLTTEHEDLMKEYNTFDNV
ncbi:hypothetical protein Tco_0635748 [Tanacetum coccineum]